ncbi:MAG: amidohydrolase family protein [Flammeovirgaceae bacterium]|nr:amidohydrolase family protein [Flammeovirgaceae bacterium]
MLKIDAHTHILPKKMPNWSEKFGYGDFIYLQHHKQGYAKMMRGNQFFREIKDNCWDADVRIEEYKQYHTQVQVVCTIPVMFSYWAQPLNCLDLSKFLNDNLAKLVDKYPKQYVGLGTIPMQDTELAVKELARIKKIGLFAHAGGSFLPTIGRIEHGFNCRPDLVAIDNNENPRKYLGKFWVDCVTHDPLMLEYVLKLQGSKRVVLGSDYPFPLGDLEIGKFIEDMNLAESVKEDIFCNATLEWLQLSKEDYITK